MSMRRAYQDKFTEAKQFTAEQHKEGKNIIQIKKKIALMKKPAGK